MLNLKSVIIGVLSGVALVYFLGAADRKGKKKPPPAGMFQLYAIHKNDSKAVILNTANGEYKIANLDLSPNLNPATDSWALRRNSTISINKKDLLRD